MRPFVQQLIDRIEPSATRGRAVASLVALLISMAPILASSQEVPGVVLNEVSPQVRRSDLGALLDEDGTPQGFVELFNRGPGPIQVGGWSLNVEGAVGGPWTFPPSLLEPGDLLRVWTSGKNRSVSGLPLHASFVLQGASSVSLLDAEGALVDRVPIAVPVDYAYGRCGDDWYYFKKPTPGSLNEAFNIASIAVLNEPVSLTVDRTHQLVALPVDDETWSATDPRVTVDANGNVRLLVDVIAPNGPPLGVEVRSPLLKATSLVQFTAVPWTANVSTLDPAVVPPLVDQILGADDAGVYFNEGVELHRSTDGIETSERLGDLPVAPASDSQLKSTPFGHFLRSGTSLHRSSDLSSWTSSFSTPLRGLRSGFDVHWDPATETGSVILSEYSTDAHNHHGVYVGTFPSSGGSSWRTVADFGSLADGQSDPARLDIARHVHASVIDPFTGDLWAGTGDSDLHSRILTGRNDAQTLEIFGMGSQDWRTLAIWFSPTHVYWNMDTTTAQSIWRVPRSMRDPVSGWPSITPELASGSTRPGVRYLVTAETETARFPVGVGGTWTETTPRSIDPGHRVRALDDPAFDYRERVARLDNGSHWFQLWVEDDLGEAVSLVATAAEGKIRDPRGRVFGLKERADGTVDVQELLTVDASPSYDPYVQLEPLAQDSLGNIYFEGRSTAQALYRMRLRWTDDDGSSTGGPTPAALEVVPPDPAHCLVAVPEPDIGIQIVAALSAVGLSALASTPSGRRRLESTPRLGSSWHYLGGRDARNRSTDSRVHGVRRLARLGR